MTDMWIEEWLFRGRPPSGPGSELSPRYHIVIGKQAPDPFDSNKLVRQLSEPILSDRLADLGFSTSGLIERFNLDALKRIAEQDALISEYKANLEAVSEHAQNLQAELDSIKARYGEVSAENELMAKMIADWRI